MFIKKFLDLNTKKHLKNNKTIRNPVGFQKANNIGIIFTTENIDKHHAIKSFVKELEDSGKNVDVLTFIGKGKQNHEFLFEFISSDDLNFWGKITNEKALYFTQTKFDYLFNIDSQRNPIIENIVARSIAKCRIGIHNNDNTSFYELLIHQKNNGSPEKMIGELHYYAQKITSDEK